MNIQNRIKKLESQTETGIFCSCPNTPKFESVYHENGKPATSSWLTKEDDKRTVPDVCGECSKPVNKTTIIVDFTDQK